MTALRERSVRKGGQFCKDWVRRGGLEEQTRVQSTHRADPGVVTFLREPLSARDENVRRALGGEMHEQKVVAYLAGQPYTIGIQRNIVGYVVLRESC